MLLPTINFPRILIFEKQTVHTLLKLIPMEKNYLQKKVFLLSFSALASLAVNAQCPTITCPANISVPSTAGNCNAVVNYTPPVGTNPCASTSQTFSYTGSIVNWTVPAGVTSVHIVAEGAQGGYNTNSTTQSGLGAIMEGDFTVTPGQVLKILVGEQPSANAGNGGGGGTFVTDNSNVPLIVAGGGGGSSQGVDSPDKHGNVTTSGGLGAGSGGVGGTNGSGGSIGSSSYFQSGAGGGLLGNGADGWTTGTGGFAFVNGGAGGPTNAPARGGFGGGGSGSSYVVGGGGGGYSGGGSGGNNGSGVGGGGGSYNAGTNQVNTGGVNTGHGEVVITYANSATVTTTMTAGLGSGGTFPVGTTTETYLVDDGLGNQSTCSFTITVNDAENPVITAPSNISVNNDAGVCGAVVTFTDPVGTDNCSGATTTLTAGLPSGSTFPVGTTTQTFTVTDGAGNTASASFLITVTDNEAPVITCPANIAVNNDPGVCGAVVTYNAPVATDNCTGSTTVQTAGLGSGATFPIGITTETYTTTDAAGNSSTCSFTVSVGDVEAPTITCPSNITVNNDPGFCYAVVTYNTPVGADNCSGTTTTQITGLGSGAAFPTGTTTETYEVTDAAGNSTTCQFIITVVDAEAPTFTCPQDVTSCFPVVGGLTLTNVNDNCMSTLPAITYTLSGATTGTGTNDASGSIFNPGTTTVMYVVTDLNGNTDSCSFTVQIHNVTSPTVSASATTACLSDAAITLNATPTGGTWTGTGVTASSFSPAAAGVGVFNPNYTYTDANGCESNANVNITVNACVGVVEENLLSGVNVYPNPNNGTFNIAINANVGDLTIEIMDAQGRVVYSSFENNVQAGFVKQISPEVMASGIYMLKLSGNGQQRLDKITIQK
jgi:hypothetical protein